MKTRSPAKSVQLTELVTPRRADPPGGLINFWQALAVVNGEDGEDGAFFFSICWWEFFKLGILFI